MTKRHNHHWLLIAFILALFFLSFTLPSGAEMRHQNKRLAGTPPNDIVRDIVSANRKAVKNYRQPKQGYAPRITWLTDPDMRIQPQLIMSAATPEVFSCRNMGAQLEIAAGQVEYGIRHLHTPILLITLNSDNQAVRFFMEGYSDLAPSIRRELDHLHLAMVQNTEEDKGKESFEGLFIKSIEANIDYQVKRAVSIYQDRISMGRLTVIGSIADFTNVYGRGKGRLIIINVNGETDEKKLRGLQLMTSISPEERKLSIGRERPLDAAEKIIDKK